MVTHKNDNDTIFWGETPLSIRMVGLFIFFSSLSFNSQSVESTLEVDKVADKVVVHCCTIFHLRSIQIPKGQHRDHLVGQLTNKVADMVADKKIGRHGVGHGGGRHGGGQGGQQNNRN